PLSTTPPVTLSAGANPAGRAAVHTDSNCPLLPVRREAREPDAREEFTMTRIALAAVFLAAAVGISYAGRHPDEASRYAAAAESAALKVREGVQANPGPVLLALGTFLLTVLYHQA